MEVTRVLRLEPSGLEFAQPARLSMRLPLGTAEETGGSAPLPLLAMRSDDRSECPDNQHAAIDLDTGDVTLSADIRHCSEVWDNLPRDGGIRVRYSGVPTEWRVGADHKFTVTSAVSQGAESTLSFIDVRWESWNNSPVRPWIICEDGCDIGILDANREQTLSRDDEYWCDAPGQGRWTAEVNFGDDLAQAVYAFLGGAESSIVFLDAGTPTYTSEPYRSIRCTAAAGGEGASGGGVALDPVRLTSLRSELHAPVTTYSIAVAGPGTLSFQWTMTGEACGTPRTPWTQTGPTSRPTTAPMRPRITRSPSP